MMDSLQLQQIVARIVFEGVTDPKIPQKERAPWNAEPWLQIAAECIKAVRAADAPDESSLSKCERDVYQAFSHPRECPAILSLVGKKDPQPEHLRACILELVRWMSKAPKT